MTLQLKTVYKTHYNKGNENTKKKIGKKRQKENPNIQLIKISVLNLKTVSKQKRRVTSTFCVFHLCGRICQNSMRHLRAYNQQNIVFKDGYFGIVQSFYKYTYSDIHTHLNKTMVC